MEAIILAGGFGTRLLPLTKYVPKALLPIAGKPVIDFQLEQLASIPEINSIVISTNAQFQENFHYWWLQLPLHIKRITRLSIEPSMKEEEKLGPVRGLEQVIERESLGNRELLVTAGDNLFGFAPADLVNYYRRRNATIVAFCDLQATERVRGKYGVGILDEDDIITSFEEKPQIPKSSLAATGCYIFPSWLLKNLSEYTSQTTKSDAIGHFIHWLSKRSKVYGFVFKNWWFDIGSFESYKEANDHYSGIRATAGVL